MGDYINGQPGVRARLPNWTGETPVAHYTNSFLARLMNHSQCARGN
jgi:hypothetical protein